MADRTVGEIVEAIQEGLPVSEDELRLTLLCCYYGGQMSASSDYERAGEILLRTRAKDNFERWFRMLRAIPAQYLGPNWTPGTPENTAQRRLQVLAAALERPKPKL